MSRSARLLRRLYEQKAEQCRRLAASASPYSVLALETLAAGYVRKAAAVAPHEAMPRTSIFDEGQLGARALRCPDCGVAINRAALAASPVVECRVCGHVIIRAQAEENAPLAMPVYETHSVGEIATRLGSHEAWVKSGGREGARAVLVQFDLSRQALSKARLPLAVLSGARLESANLDGADLAVSDFGSADLSGASLVAADLRGANLENATLDEANLSTARLSPLRDVGESNIDLPARLGNAKLRGARLAGVDFRGANLVGADFSGADLRDADFRHARLDGMNVAGAKLDRVRW